MTQPDDAERPTATHFTDDPTAPQPSAWVPETDPVRIAILGKALEEHGECTKALARCVIQGIAERDPESHVPNLIAAHAEMADVAASHELVLELIHAEAARCGLDVDQLRDAFTARVQRKLAHKRGWHRALRERGHESTPVLAAPRKFNPMSTAPRDGITVLLHSSILTGADGLGKVVVGRYHHAEDFRGWQLLREGHGGGVVIYMEATFDGWLPMSEART